MGASQAKLLAMLLAAAIWSSIVMTIRCSNALKAKHEGFSAAYKNVSLEKRKLWVYIWGRQHHENQRQLKWKREIAAPVPPAHKQNGRNKQA